ncbi:Iron(3+)-hydroxamate import ATP-binding protein FhuC [Methyloligella halotolerans]|uniref:Iron(3+)-hydroxamate import ATP-binding protein FhuC n=1 Tax=Methyloligella halotolerans TaxID=1177755 RepID=A0A1E2RX81_9HYPH|nr:ABC transporter ATP-binding protein [Methyloligella halotolerans]ODA66740.1 Iron(3+)-hydroxamate import ATP-binding protein FhuC [Methyloligella halotolerans]
MSGVDTASASLTAEKIALAHGKGEALLRDVSFAVAPGELIGLVGANGAGKSSLMHVLAGLRAPTEGRVLLHGEPLDDIDRSDRAQKLAYLPQTRAVHWPLKVRDLVALGRLPYRRPFMGMSGTDREAIERAMSMTHTLGLAGRQADTLSGGELARVLLARALAQTPTVLLADEPIAALDPAYQFRILNLLRRAVDQGIAVLAVFHDLPLAARYCDRLILLHDGALHAMGTPQEVLTEATVETVYGIKVEIDDTGNWLSVTPIDVTDEDATA